ncbi:MAG TPA: hypothetical protein VFP89_07820 [Propionibacteriaceae bacterium]|nr:hypothetical protein [Propionibacteriaceae bacterium]
MTDLERFLAFSSEVTAYSIFELRGTGVAEAYLATVEEVVGRQLLEALLDRYESAVAAAAEGGATLPDLLRRELFSDPRLGPVARNIVKMFYLGIWYELPHAWTEAYGARRSNLTFTVSAAAYTEGLVWPSIGANPAGAKAPGYGSWAQPPRIPAVP